jgi:hypothetical protein
MDDLSRYLKKFKVLLGDKTEEKRLVQKIIKEVCAADLSLETIAIKDMKINLKVSPVMRTEIALNKKKILSLLKEQGFSATDVR